jgi:dolichol-phosphate mannosyltransferase
LKRDTSSAQIAVVIPCFRVRYHIDDVISRIGPEVSSIYVVDDACPEGTGAHVSSSCKDPRVVVLRHEANAGVGAAMVTGYRRAASDGADVIVKVDGDGQMDPALIPRFAAPILDGRADYTKGNRFYHLDSLTGMPPWRLVGNAALSFMTKLSSGYWTVFDPTNGYTAVNSVVLRQINLAKLSNRYFFESDILFRLGTVRAFVLDIPMDAVYGDQSSNMNLRRIIIPFFAGHLRNFAKRIFYNYVLRDFTAASLELLFGMGFLLFGAIFGTVAWISSSQTGVPSTTGTVMLSALPIILGIQLLLSFISYDVASTPSRAIHPLLDDPGPEWRALLRLNQEAMPSHS